MHSLTMRNIIPPNIEKPLREAMLLRGRAEKVQRCRSYSMAVYCCCNVAVAVPSVQRDVRFPNVLTGEFAVAVLVL